MKLLLARQCPRLNIQEVEEQILPCDVLKVCFLPEYQCFQEIRNYFLATDYTHLVIASDDIVVKPEHVIQLQKDLEEYDYQVIGGMMNVDEPEYQLPQGQLNISLELPFKSRKTRWYTWIHRQELPEQNIFQVKFNGFSLLSIRRDVVSEHVFVGDMFWVDEPEKGASYDLTFCWWCHENNIPVFTDKRIDMKHLRASGTQRVRVEPPIINLIKCKEIIQT